MSESLGRRELLERLRAEETEPFAGWDFSHLRGRMVEESEPWDYTGLVLNALPTTTSLLDMGTGGGEFLIGLRPLPPDTRATESYAPNLPIARRRLEPLGIAVVAIEDDTRLPFAAATFDLVINRHESYDPPEVYRILRPGGRFITQQVGGQNNTDLNRLLGAPNADFGMAEWDLAFAEAQLRDAGFAIECAEESFPTARFTDVGAVVYYLKVIFWQIPDFAVDRYADRLEDLDRRVRAGESITVLSHRFFLNVVKPAS